MKKRQMAIFTRQLNCMGGIERVVIEQVRIFKHHGLEVVLLLEEEPNYKGYLFDCRCIVLPMECKCRVKVLENFLKAQSLDSVIFHGLSRKFAKIDVVTFSQFNVATVVAIHFPFHQTIALDCGYNAIADYTNRGEGCTAFATVSAIDAVFWRALGKKAFHVQNPFVHPSKNVERCQRDGKDGLANLLWVGRLCEQKQPASALVAFALALKVCPNITLTMVGGDIKGIKSLQKKALRLGILEKVEFVPERPDINEYWEKADIHLLTSICESFCLVWAEAKAAGIPTVMFDLPYLELAEDKRGYIAVEQRNVQALADAIIALVNDGKRRLSMGCEAKASLAPFNDEAVWESWARVFEGINETNAGLEVDADLKTIVSQVYMAVCYDKDTHRWPEEMVTDWQKVTRTSMRPIANALHWVVGALQKIKAKIRE